MLFVVPCRYVGYSFSATHCTVENLAYQKDSFVNSRRQYKRHTRRHQMSDGDNTLINRHHPLDAQNHVDSGVHSCTVLDNFYVETPVWMVDLGKRTTVSGVIIVTWPGNPNGTPIHPLQSTIDGRTDLTEARATEDGAVGQLVNSKECLYLN